MHTWSIERLLGHEAVPMHVQTLKVCEKPPLVHYQNSFKRGGQSLHWFTERI